MINEQYIQSQNNILPPGEEYIEEQVPSPEQQAMMQADAEQEALAQAEIEAQRRAEQSMIDLLEARHAMTNIAENLEQSVIDTIAAKVIDGYNLDKESRAEWEKTNTEVLKLAKLSIEKKMYAGDVVANVKYPIITNAGIQFAARAYPEIIKGTEVVKPKIIGYDPDGLKLERGNRICEHMSYQLLNEMSEWEDGVDQLLFTLPIVGCAFKKTYYSTLLGQNVSEMVFADDLVVNINTVSLEKALRVTHIIQLSQNEIVERIRNGVFLDFDVSELGLAQNTEDAIIDEDTPHKFLEQHRWYDLDEDGYQEPYICTVHEGTQKLVRMSARFELANVTGNKKKEIVRIKPTHYFTRFIFMPAVDGSFYGNGFGSLLYSINSATNTTLNQLLDAGTLSNRQSGFLGRGIQLGRGASLKFKAGEWKPIQSTGDDLRKNIVPLPTKEPSPTLFRLLGLLVETGKELSGVTDVLSGQSPGPNVPATTTLALIEQGLQVYSAIHKRIHKSLYAEFQKIRQLNILYLTDQKYANVMDDPGAIRRDDYADKDMDIIPVSDPTATTNMQRIMKAKALLEMRGQGLSDMEINKRYLEALQIENTQILIPEEDEPNPALELEIQEKQAAIEKINAETSLIIEKINTERVIQNTKAMGAGFDNRKLDIEEAKAISNIETNEINKFSEQKTQGPYREAGMVSNNDE